MTMKTFTISAALVALYVASAHAAANPARMRTQTQHKSMNKAHVQSDESYEQYLGMDNRQLEESMSMSISISMSMAPTSTPPTPSPTAEESG